MGKRYVIPRVRRRGIGLGNELFGWAKAYIASQVLDASALHPAWGLNPRGYHYYFQTSRLDWGYHAALRQVLPCYTFDYNAYGAQSGFNYAQAVELYAKEHDLFKKGTYVLDVEGMSGGFQAIAPAREFIRSSLFQTRGAAHNVGNAFLKIESENIVVGIHIRLGDFEEAAKAQDYQGKFNISLPFDWYINIIKQLKSQLGERVSFVVVSDGTKKQLEPLRAVTDFTTTDEQNHTDISDLLVLSQCDLVVCSVSSYSLWAAFLSGRPYFWFKPNLSKQGNMLSIWGNEEMQVEKGIAHQHDENVDFNDEDAFTRGIPLGEKDALPSCLAAYFDTLLQVKNARSDLLYYGLVKAE